MGELLQQKGKDCHVHRALLIMLLFGVEMQELTNGRGGSSPDGRMSMGVGFFNVELIFRL